MATIVQPRRGPLLEWRKAKAESLRGLERRTFAAGDLEIREADDGTLSLTGYAAVFDTPYEVGFYVETVKRSAFDRTLREAPDVVLLVGHEGLPLARTKAGTLRLSADDIGLHVDADLDPDDPDTIRLKRKRDRGDLDGQMSMAFQVTSQKWDDDYTRRDLLGVSLHRGDVSVVVHGASPTTSSSIRSTDAALVLHDIGAEGVVRAFTEWRDYTLLTVEQRAGKTLSAATMEVLTQVSTLVSAAEESLDEAIPLLDELMGVINPESDDGEADTVERSITNEKGLCAAIRAVAREPGQDERRAAIITRAAELDRGGLIPDAWQPDGTLPEGRALATPEQRETYNDTYAALQGALDEKLEGEGFWYWWIQDFTADEVIFYASGDYDGGNLWKAPYALVPSGPVTIGEAVRVRPVTNYVEVVEPPEPPEVETLSLPDYTTRARQEYELLMLRGGKR